MLKIVPYDIAWGGRLESDSQMYAFELVSILLNALLIVLLLIKGRFIREILPIKIVNVLLWIFLVLFALNTVGNLLAKTNFEKFFAIATLALCILLGVVLTRRDAADLN